MKFSGFNTTAKIGIGTNDPGRSLHVRGEGNTSVVRVGDGDTDGAAAIAYIEFGADGSSWNRHSYVGSAGADSHLWIVNEENADIKFYANNAEKMVIKNDGNVGINTTSPSAILHIKSSGTARNVFYVAASDNSHLAGIYEESDGRGALNVRNAAGTATINLDSGNDSWFTGGNFGIGTTSLYAGTNVTSLTINATSYPSLALYIGGTISHLITGVSNILNIDAIGNRSIALRTNDVDRLTISAAGAITAQTDQNNSTIFKVKNATASTSSDAQLRCESSSSLGLITAMPSSYSTSSAYVADSFLVLAASTCSAGLGLAAEGANPINLWTNNTKRVTVDSAGKVGIGTATPSSKFHIWDGSTVDAFKVENYNRGAVWNSVGAGGMYSEYQLTGTWKFRLGQANHLVSGASVNDFALSYAGNLLLLPFERMLTSSVTELIG
jgi:hypothetical protein